MLSAAYNSLILENMMNSSGGCKPGFLKSKNRLSAEAIKTIKEGYRKVYDNKETREKILVLNDGVEFEPISSTAAELQMNENKKTNSIEICKLFGFPHTIIDGGASDDDNKKFISAVISFLNQIETELDRVLLLETEKEQGFYFAFDTKELTRGNILERYQAYEIARRNNILQIDEIRCEEDFQPLGFNFLTLNLSDVLINPETMEVFTPNTGQSKNLLTGEERAETEMRGRQWIKGEHGYFAGSTSTGGGGSSGGAKAEKGLDKSEKGDIIKADNKKRLQEMINNGDVSLDINTDVQNRHYKGTYEYNAFLERGVEKSYFNVPQSDLQSFLNKNATTGDIYFDNKGGVKEVLKFEDNVAYDTKVKANTSYVTAHYSKNRTHLASYTPKENK
ncbi:MAG: phage portal protein [Ruminococcus sp.]|nr:phage portal protein [Ruminococcus sp.]